MHAPAPSTTDGSTATAFDMRDLANYATPPRIDAVQFSTGQMALRWEDGRISRFHGMWLRDNCACPVCKHPQALERTYMFLDHAAPEIESARHIEGAGVEVVFVQDGQRHTSGFSAAWLRHHCYSPEALAQRRPMRRLWDASHGSALVAVDYRDYATKDRGTLAWIDALTTHGIVLLRGVPTEPGKLVEVANRIGPVRSSNFGAYYDVISMPDPNAVAYTSLGLELHTDLANWRFPPDIQMLCCLENSVAGGGSIFVDGFKVAEDLRREDPASFDLLATQALTFRFQDRACDIETSAPTLALDSAGALSQIRFNNWLRSTMRLPADRIEPTYAALGALWRRLRDRKFQLTMKLEPGDLITYDNHRVLHGRESFDAQTGHRHLQGCYLNREDIESRRAVLAR